ncbi:MULTISPECIES: hypothetical protein [unclassified Bradyrhizobium]|uniref:hypothetical protein n=1 Tax=unclassified Bradyrhizobium TaxID=2631580 RepID=UPI0028E98CF5|nr:MULTISPECIES: hypothetical protein [unclassified Bradyrhizobium]
MTSIDLHRGTARGFGKGSAAPLARTISRIRAAFRTIHAAIAAAKIRRLRNELMLRGSPAGAPSIVPDPIRQPQVPLILSDKWDF